MKTGHSVETVGTGVTWHIRTNKMENFKQSQTLFGCVIEEEELEE